MFFEPTLCVSSWRSLNRMAAAPTMPQGSGVGVLPFTVNPVSPTGSTNCDTGTTTLHHFHLQWIFGILIHSDSFTGTFKLWVNVCGVSSFLCFHLLSHFTHMNNAKPFCINLHQRTVHQTIYSSVIDSHQLLPLLRRNKLQFYTVDL